MNDLLLDEYWNGRQLYQGSKGGKYYVSDAGNKMYVRENLKSRKQKAEVRPKRKFTPKRGAFYRSLMSQKQL